MVKRDFEQLKRRRGKGARLLEAGEKPAEVARILGVTRQTASRWQKQLGTAGRRQMVEGAGRAGRKPKLNAGQLARLESELVRGPQAHGFKTQLWTLARVAQIIRRTTGARLHRGHVWRVLRALGWSVQRPQTKARERDEEAIRRWVRVKWPAIKKSKAATPVARVHGRERREQEAAAVEHMGEKRLHAGAGAQLQLEKTPGGQRAGASLGRSSTGPRREFFAGDARIGKKRGLFRERADARAVARADRGDGVVAAEDLRENQQARGIHVGARARVVNRRVAVRETARGRRRAVGGAVSAIIAIIENENVEAARGHRHY